jgi:hypothetical protein
LLLRLDKDPSVVSWPFQSFGVYFAASDFLTNVLKE